MARRSRWAEGSDGSEDAKNWGKIKRTCGVHPFGETIVLLPGFVNRCAFVFPAYAGTGFVAHE